MSNALAEHIRDGTFPGSDELLSRNVSPDGVSSLLASIQRSKSELRGEIQDVSQNVAGDVDGWISQAKKIQEDIARCKIEARNIIEEHQRGEALRNAVQDASDKVKLLETEVAFTKALEHEIRTISEVTRVLDETEHVLSVGDPVFAVNKLVSVEAAIQDIPATRARTLLDQLTNEMREKAETQLKSLIQSRWNVTKSQTNITLRAATDTELPQPSNADSIFTSTDNALSALQKLGGLPSATSLILRIVDSFVTSLLSPKSALCPSDVEERNESLMINRDGTDKDAHKVLAISRTVLQFLHNRLPAQIRDAVAEEVVPKMAQNLITTWLDLALPYELHDLHNLEPLQKEVSAVAMAIEQYSWPGADVLNEWIEQIPRNWLAKRRAASLDSVRKAFSLARGLLRPVERIERQVVVVEAVKVNSKDEDDSWNADWEDEPDKQEPTKKKTAEDEDVSGWDFETDDDQDKSNKTTEPKDAENEDDAGDAWGWGDDDDAKAEPDISSRSPSRPKTQPVNGEVSSGSKEQEMVLTETYHITDIPDYVLETIGKDMADSHELQSSESTYFASGSPASGLSGLPNLTLAMFRAIAPTYYTLPSATYNLSNINLYNDVLYLIQRLDSGPDSASLQPAVQQLQKFARQVYSSELETQRTVVSDLLDGAQGFERCTTFPSSQACSDAVSSVTDRLRFLSSEWSSVLGESHLLQSLGLLLTLIFGKMIKDVEDLDDISEAESKQLLVYCQQLSSLENLFVSSYSSTTTTTQTEPDSNSNSQVLLYVPNYLRFQYLQQILESSLVDIRYLWTEGELSLEFGVDEVVDLIRALFAESQYRRDAIRAIKGSSAGH